MAENWFNSTCWYRVRISQVTDDPLNKLCSSNTFTFRLVQILRWSSLKKLLENNELVLWNIILWSSCLVKYSSLKPWSFLIQPLESSKFWVLCKGPNWKQIHNTTSHRLFWSATWIFVCPTIKPLASWLFSLEISSLATEVLVPSKRKHKLKCSNYFFIQFFMGRLCCRFFCAFYYKLVQKNICVCILSFPDSLPRSRIRIRPFFNS